MNTRLGMAAAALMLAAASLGAVAGTGSALAREARPETVSASPERALQGVPEWLQRSIIGCTAETTGLDAETVKLALRQGHTLAEIGIRAGIRPAELEAGILRCERNILVRMVQAGEIEPVRARRVFQFLSDNITRIINASWDA